MTDAKFVLIGGGSYSWTATLVTDLAMNPALHGLNVVLHDINSQALATMTPLCQEISRAAGADLKIESSMDLDSALSGADFVGATISTGGQSADVLDMSIPLRHNIIQTVADTVGPGGWSRALRNIPVMVDIIRKVEAIAPNAWFMNYTNPMTVLTRALHQVSDVRTVGICHELQGLLLHAAYFFDADWEDDFSVNIAGINHLIWVLDMKFKGRDGLEAFKKYAKEPELLKLLDAAKMPEELKRSGGAAPSQLVKLDLLRRTGFLPAAGDSHIAEFFPFYLSSDGEARRWGFDRSVKAHTFAREESRSAVQKKCEDMASGKRPLNLVHSHEHADRIIAALIGCGKPLATPLNLANVGQIDNLPREVVVETLAYVQEGAIQPLAVGKLPEPMASYLMPHIANQEMIVEAGLSGDRELAILALANDPRISSPDVARKMADEFFEEFRPLLPQFHGEWSL